jgi:hypothetical protein
MPDAVGGRPGRGGTVSRVTSPLRYLESLRCESCHVANGTRKVTGLRDALSGWCFLLTGFRRRSDVTRRAA